ncbi:MAG: hypothetical protein WC879_06225 [Melioribacteraceae bacterium]
MILLTDYKKRKIRFTFERIKHLEDSHPEMKNQISRINETLESPDCIIKSKSDLSVEMFYKYYESRL